MAEDSGEKLTLSIKPTAQQNAKYTVSIESVQTILELKEAVHQAMGASGYPAAEQRLIYKGQILKDERTVSSYGEFALRTLKHASGTTCTINAR